MNEQWSRLLTVLVVLVSAAFVSAAVRLGWTAAGWWLSLLESPRTAPAGFHFDKFKASDDNEQRKFEKFKG